jgi:hypothetical protein
LWSLGSESTPSRNIVKHFDLFYTYLDGLGNSGFSAFELNSFIEFGLGLLLSVFIISVDVSIKLIATNPAKFNAL